MNILIITATYPPSANGVAVSTGRTVAMLRSLGHRVIVIGPEISSYKDKDYRALPTLRIPFFGLSDYPVPLPMNTSLFARKLPQIKWDIIHVHHPSFIGQFALSLGKKIKVPVFFTYHTQYDTYLNHLYFLPRKFKDYLYKKHVFNQLIKFNGVIATTKWMQKKLITDTRKKDIYYVSTAGLRDFFKINNSVHRLRAMLGLPLKEPILLSVSRLSPEKKTVIFLNGFLKWASEHKQGILVIIGDGLYRRTLENIACRHPQGHRVRFMGRIANESLPPWYSSATLFLYSSVTDTIGINIIEAMSAGLPVVAPDHDTTREVIRDGYNGILSDESPDSFAHAIEQAIRNRVSLSKGAMKTAQLYDLTLLTKKLVICYEEICKRYR